MSDLKINNYTLNEEAREIARLAVLEEKAYGTDAQQTLHEMCDGHEWATYTYNAFQVCAEGNTDEGEDNVEDLGQSLTDIRAHAHAVAYATLLAKATEHYTELAELTD